MPLADEAWALGRLARQYLAAQESSKGELLSKLNDLGQAWGIRLRDYKGGLLVTVPEERSKLVRIPRELHHIAFVIIVEDEHGRCLEALKDRTGDYTPTTFEPLSSWERLLGEDIV